MSYSKYLAELFVDTVVGLRMGATPKVSETTSFIYDDEKLVLVDSEEEKNPQEEERRRFSKRTLAEDEYWMLIPSAIQEREYPIFQTLHAYFLEKIQQYILLKAEDSKGSGYTSSKENTYKDLAKDMMNSQVLDRLISGKPLLSTPPPKSYFHHWYELVDDGEAVCMDVSISSVTKWEASKDKKVTVARIDGEEWNILEDLSEDGEGLEYIVQWKNTEYVYKLSRMEANDYERMLHPYQRKLVTKDNYSWKLTRFTKGESNE